MATIPVCENGLPVALAMNRLRGRMPRTILASPSRKTMSPSRRTLRPQRLQRAIAGFTGSGGSCPVPRARVAAGPQKLPVQPGDFIQSVASAAPRSSVHSAIIQQQNQSKVSILVRLGELVPEHLAPSRTSSRSRETSVHGTGFGVAAEGLIRRLNEALSRSSHYRRERTPRRAMIKDVRTSDGWAH